MEKQTTITYKQDFKMGAGGKRKGAGRKPCSDKKQTVALYIETSIIKELGGIESAKEILYSFAKTEAGRD